MYSLYFRFNSGEESYKLATVSHTLKEELYYMLSNMLCDHDKYDYSINFIFSENISYNNKHSDINDENDTSNCSDFSDDSSICSHTCEINIMKMIQVIVVILVMILVYVVIHVKLIVKYFFNH